MIPSAILVHYLSFCLIGLQHRPHMNSSNAFLLVCDSTCIVLIRNPKAQPSPLLLDYLDLP